MYTPRIRLITAIIWTVQQFVCGQSWNTVVCLLCNFIGCGRTFAQNETELKPINQIVDWRKTMQRFVHERRRLTQEYAHCIMCYMLSMDVIRHAWHKSWRFFSGPLAGFQSASTIVVEEKGVVFEVDAVDSISIVCRCSHHTPPHTATFICWMEYFGIESYSEINS